MGSPFGAALDARLARHLREVERLEAGGDRLDGHRSGLQRIAQRGQRRLQRRHEHAGGAAGAPAGLASASLSARSAKRPRVGGALALVVAGGRGEGLAGAADRVDGLLVARRVERRRRVQHRAEAGGGLLDQRQLGVLVLRHKGRERGDPRHVGQLAQLLGGEIGCRQVRREHADRLRVGLRVLHQADQGGDRLGVLVVEVQRVEVEPEIAQQRRAGDRHGERADDDDVAVALDEIVDRRQELVADRLALRLGLDDGEQRRQHGDRTGEGDQHAGAGDLAEVGDAAVGGGQEGVEAGHGGERRQRQRAPDLGRADDERVLELRLVVEFGLEAHGELDAEVDADADEQNGRRRSDSTLS